MRGPDKPGPGWRSVRRLALAAALLPLAAGPQAADPGLPVPPARDFSGQAACPVLEVQAGNVLLASWQGRPTVVRLIGTYVPARGAEAEAARDFLTRLLAGECIYIELEPDWPQRDREERLWAYVHRAPDGLLVNLELVRLGYARVSAAAPFRHEELLRAYEQVARRGHKGLWAPRAAAEEPAPPASQPAAASAPAAAPAAGEVLVYVTAHGTKYHRADCRFVRQGALARTLAEARARGYSPCAVCQPPQ